MTFCPRGPRFLNRDSEFLLDLAILIGAEPKAVPLGGVLSILAQREMVGDPEQRSTDSQLVNIARCVKDHRAGRDQARSRSRMRFGPSPNDCPMGATQREREVNGRRSEQNSGELSSGNENRRVGGSNLFGYLERDHLLPPDRQRTLFDIRPGDDFVQQLTQCSPIPVVATLDMEWATDRDRSLTLPIRQTS